MQPKFTSFSFLINSIFILIFVISIGLLYSSEVDISKKYYAFLAIVIHILSGKILLRNTNSILRIFNPTIMYYLSFEIFIGIGTIIIYLFPEYLINILNIGDNFQNDLLTYMILMAVSVIIFAMSDLVYSKKKQPIIKNDISLLISNINAKWILLISGFGICLLSGIIRFSLQDSFLEIINMLFSGEISGGAYRKTITTSQHSGGSYFGQGYFNFLSYQIISLRIISVVLVKNQKKPNKIDNFNTFFYS